MAGAARTPTPMDHWDNPYNRAWVLDVANYAAGDPDIDLEAELGGPCTGIMWNKAANTGTITVKFHGNPTEAIELTIGRGCVFPFRLVAVDLTSLPTNDFVFFG